MLLYKLLYIQRYHLSCLAQIVEFQAYKSFFPLWVVIDTTHDLQRRPYLKRVAP